MRFDTKIAVVVRNDLQTWQKLNVGCFLAGGLVGAYPELAGERYIDASGRSYGPLVRQPVVIFAASESELTRTFRRAVERGVAVSIYTQDLCDRKRRGQSRRRARGCNRQSRPRWSCAPCRSAGG